MSRALTAEERAAGEHIIADDMRIIKQMERDLNSRNEHDRLQAQAEIAYRNERIGKIRASLASGVAPEGY